MLLDQKQNINYDYAIMPDPGHTETGGASVDKVRLAETRDIARKAALKESRAKIATLPADDPQRKQLEFGISLYDVASPSKTDIPKKQPGEPGSDLHPPVTAFDGATMDDGSPLAFKDADGNEIKFTDLRIATIEGTDNEGNLVVTFHDDKDQPVMHEGKPFQYQLTRDELFDAQIAAEPVYEDLGSEQTKGVIKAARQAAQFDRGEEGPPDLPNDQDLQAVRDEHGIVKDEPEPDEPEAEQKAETPLEKADAIIADHIAQIESKLKDPEFKDKKEREKLGKVLLSLRMAAGAKGRSRVLAVSAALQKLTDGGQGDFTGQIADLASDEMGAQPNAKYALEQDGIAEDDPLMEMISNGDVMGILNDKRSKNLSNFAREVFGNNPPKLEDLLKDIDGIKPEVLKALKDAESSGNFGLIWKILLGLVASPVLLIGAAGAGGLIIAAGGLQGGGR